MTTSFYVGQRLSYDGAICTVRYLGTLLGSKGDWLGVEWDNVDRGKHDGSHQGDRIFQILSNSSTAASFIRPTRRHDSTRTVLEALHYKYGSKPVANGTIKPDINQEVQIVHISGKVVEEIGFDKIQKQIGQFQDLQVILLDELKVTGLTRAKSLEARGKASKEFAESCPNITELDLGWNLIEEWQDVADICKHLRKLKILKTSGLRLNSFSVELKEGESPFSDVEELHLNETLLSPNQILSILNCTGEPAFPKLTTLHLSLNELSDFETAHPPTLRFPSITTLNLSNNHFTTLSALPTIFTHFPSLKSISLQSNRITTLILRHANPFPALHHLLLTSNLLPTFSSLSPIPTLFPNLTSLLISSNPFTLTLPPTAPIDASYYLTLARIPSLKALNYTTITLRDREEGEIYYLSVAEKAITSILSSQGPEAASAFVQGEYDRYAELCIKYERPNLLESPSPAFTASTPKHPSGSLASRIVKCTFYIPSTYIATDTQSLEISWTNPIPKTLNVYTLKSMVHRHFGLAPLQFRLIYESPELDPIPETTRKMYSGPVDWERWGDFDVDVSSDGTMGRNDGHGEDTGKSGGGDEERGLVGRDGEWVDGVLYRDGAKWRRRETEIIDGMRSWGDFLDGGEESARIRVEPKEADWEDHRQEWRKEDTEVMS